MNGDLKKFENIVDEISEAIGEAILYKLNEEKVMTEIKNTITLDVNMPKQEIIKILKQHKYTRYPITKNKQIIGLLNIKDFFHCSSRCQQLPLLRFFQMQSDVFESPESMYYNLYGRY